MQIYFILIKRERERGGGKRKRNRVIKMYLIILKILIIAIKDISKIFRISKINKNVIFSDFFNKKMFSRHYIVRGNNVIVNL